MFTEPVVITACEFLEQNASSSSPMVTLNGYEYGSITVLFTVAVEVCHDFLIVLMHSCKS